MIEREGKKLHRYRAKDYRIYFERSPEGVTVHRVLHKNTLRDFLFRSKLPMAEDDQLGKTREFWKLIEQGERTPQSLMRRALDIVDALRRREFSTCSARSIAPTPRMRSCREELPKR